MVSYGGSNLTKRQIVLKGTIIALIVTAPSLAVFFAVWVISDNLAYGMVSGGVVHFVAMGFSLRISRRLSRA